MMKGEYTELVTLKKKTVSYDENNEEIPEWDSNDTEIYAEFFERHGKEGESDGQILVVQDVRCKVRYREALDTSANPDAEGDHRIERGSITYDVKSIVPVGRRKELRLILERRR